MHRVPEVIDCWFDSGAMPFAQWHYPFENKDIFEENFPADFISEAVDQTRGWFYSLLAESTLLFNKAPYKNVIVLGHVQTKTVRRCPSLRAMRLIRLTHLKSTARTQFAGTSIQTVLHGYRIVSMTVRFQKDNGKFMGTLWNTYAFFVLYANIDEFDATKYTLEYDKLSVMDKWLLSKLNTLVKTVDDNLANYKITETARVLDNFVDELSNWYVRRSRARFWLRK